MRWLVADSLYCGAQFFCSHLSSYTHYLNEFGEKASYCELTPTCTAEAYARSPAVDVLFALDQYDKVVAWPATKRIAQIAAICNPMPWDVRKPDGSPAYNLVISSIPWMLDRAREMGCRAEYMPLAFDTRARVCGMGVERDLGCIFIGTTGPNHVRRTQLLEELKDVAMVMPPVFGREYFKALARAKVVLNVHAEWARGAANAMRLYEAAGMGCEVVSDGQAEDGDQWWHGPTQFDDAGEVRGWVANLDYGFYGRQPASKHVLAGHTYENRIPRLVELARSL